MGVFDHLPSIPPPPRPDLQPLPGTVPLTPQAAVLPPLIYYLALILLPPFPESSSPTLKTLQRYLIPFARNTLALLSAILFFRLPLAYHVPFSIGLTYQLSLVGLYGGCRVIDVFFITFYWLGHVPRRVKYHHTPRHEDGSTPPAVDDDDNTTTTSAPHHPHRNRAPSQSYFSLHFLRTAGLGPPVTETASTHPVYPTSPLDRLSFALELLLSMRGAGFTWTSADVRHTRRTWRPSARDRGWSILVHVLPTLALGWAVVRDVWVHYLAAAEAMGPRGDEGEEGFDGLPFAVQIALTGALGGVLMSGFSLAYSAGGIVLGELGEHALAYWPPLYSVRVWEVQSVRGFWGYGWHRLFSRLFLVWGVWPGEWLERRVRGLWMGRKWEGEADVGKVMGGFCCSAFVHAFAGHAVLGGWRNGAGGEAMFFVENGVAVCVEEGVKRWIKRWRRGRDGKGREERWYDGVVGRVWWISVLLFTGRNFARGWVKAGLVTEMAGA